MCPSRPWRCWNSTWTCSWRTVSHAATSASPGSRRRCKIWPWWWMRISQAQTVEEALRAAGGDLLRHVDLFDLYQGEQIPAGKKSLAYALTFQAEDRSLTEDEVLQLYQRIQQHAATTLGAELRR